MRRAKLRWSVVQAILSVFFTALAVDCVRVFLLAWPGQPKAEKEESARVDVQSRLYVREVSDSFLGL